MTTLASENPLVAPDSLPSLRPPEPKGAVGITSGSGVDDETLAVPLESAFTRETDLLRFEIIPEPTFQLEDLPPVFRRAVGGNLDLARSIYIETPDSIGAYMDRHVLKEMAALPEEESAGRLSITGALGLSPDSTGMTEANFLYWMEKDKPYLTRRMEERDILKKSGAGGYATEKLVGKELSRAEARIIAEVESIVLGKYTDGVGGMLERAAYDIRAGTGSVGIFAANAAHGAAWLLSDASDLGAALLETMKGNLYRARKNSSRKSYAANLLEYASELRKDAEAHWSAPEIDTGSPWLDYGRSAIFRGVPFMAGSVALASIPGVGAAGAAGIIATGMGADTYGTLRDENISPVLSLAAGAATFVGSYFSTKFQLDNLTRYFGGRAPMRLWSARTGLEVLGEAGQEAAENITQTFAEGAARLIGNEDYNAVKFWNDLKSGLLGALDEGASVGLTTAAMRIFGFPIAARNQMRASAFAKTFTRAAESIGKTEMFKKQPEAMAGHLTNMAWHHGDGRVFTTFESLNQAGVTREQATAPVAEGGLGVTGAAYDEAGATGGTLTVGYGEAMVFGQKQAEGGNRAALGAFMLAPDAMSVGDIVRQRAETEAIITQSEAYYQEEVKEDSPKTPLRLKVFKAGLRAAGFDAYQAAAMTAMYRAGAERNAELAGETVEAWLERKNVRLEFERTLLNTGKAEAARYVKLLQELDGGQEAQAEGEAATGVPVMEAAQADTGGETLTQAAVGDADNQAWIDEATANIVNSIGLQGEQFAPLAQGIRDALTQGINNPDVRAIAGQLGIELPEGKNYGEIGKKIGAFFDLTQNSPPETFIEMVVEEELSLAEVERIRQKSGRDLAGFSRTMDNYGIIHALNNHGESKETGPGQAPITKEDFLRIPEIVGEPDDIRYRQRKGTADTITSEKEIDGIVYVVEEIRTKAKKLAFKTMYKKIEGDWQNHAFRKTAGRGSESPSMDNIPGKDGDVNPDTPIIETLYQTPVSANVRGKIEFRPDAAVIKLFKNADVSTVVHELNHLFVRDLVDMVKAGRGGETARAHVDALNAFAGGNLLSDDGEKRTAAYEKIARAWEHYAMHGEAPAPALEDPFATIRKYMAAVYRRAEESQIVEPSTAVRNVFDRMLATDRQIEDAARDRETKYNWTKAGNSGAAVQQRMDAINARRDERARKRMDAGRGAGRALRGESILDARRRVVKGELSEEPVYRALDIARVKGGLNRPSAVALVGETAVLKIEKAHGGGVFAEKETDGASISEVAAMAGYSFDTVADMLADMAEAEALDVRAERKARSEMDAGELAEDLELEARDEAEGADDEAVRPKAVDAFSEWWREDALETADADERDMAEEVELAIENEVADGGDAAPARELGERLKAGGRHMAALKRAAYEKVAAMQLREAADIRGFSGARNGARRLAYKASLKGDRAKVTALKMQELYHFYEMRAGMEARQLRQRVWEKYGSRSLQSAINGTDEHQAKVKYEYAQSLAEVALYAGFADSRFLRDLAGKRAGAAELELPRESDELEGIAQNIGDTLDDWFVFKERPENFRDFRDFTVTQVKDIDRVMRWLIDNGRGKLAYIQEKDIRNLEDLMRQSIEPILRRDPRDSKIDHDDRTVNGHALNRVKRFVISLTIPENWFMAMDGNPTIQGEAAGVNQRLLFETMLKANTARDALYGDVIARMKPGFDVLHAMKKRLEKTFGGKLFTVEGLPLPEILKHGRNIASWDADLLISIALQMGNDANLRRLLTDADFDMRFGAKSTPEGGQDMTAPRYNFTNAQLDIIAGLFTEAEWEAIQGLWDGIDSLYGEADAVTFALTDRHVKKEEATPVQVRTTDGKNIVLRGGYFPLVNDPMLSDRAEQLNQGQTIEEYIHSGLLGNTLGATKRKVGALKSRARDEQGVPAVTLPQILSTSIIVQHIDAMAHYITHAKPLRDIDRLTRSEEWKSAYVSRFGQEQYDAIRKWVKNLAMPERGDASAAGRFMERMRSLATVNALGLRWKTGIKQRLGAFQAAAYMGDAAGSRFTGWKYLVQGVNEMGVRGNIGFHIEKIDAVNAKSEYMAARNGGFDREVRAMRNKLSPLDTEMLGRSFGDWQNMAFFWIQANDQAMAYAVWLGAYKQARAGEAGFGLGAVEGETEAETEARIEREAVAFADRAARTQASSFAADLTEIQRDRGFMRFMSMFMSGNVRQGSRLMQYMDAYRMGDKTKGDVAMLAAREFAFPALAWVFMAAAVKSALSAALGWDDDDGNLLVDAIWETADTAVAPFPLLREAPRIMRYGGLAGDVPAVKSTAQAANNLFGVPGRLAEARYMLAVGQVMRSAGYAFGIPLMNPLDDFGVSEAIGLKKVKK